MVLSALSYTFCDDDRVETCCSIKCLEFQRGQLDPEPANGPLGLGLLLISNKVDHGNCSPPLTV